MGSEMIGRIGGRPPSSRDQDLAEPVRRTDYDASVNRKRPRRRILSGVGPLEPAVGLVHAASALIASVFLLVLSNRNWFFLDEWDFLVNRRVQLSGTQGLFYPHNEHWSTIPILIWRAIFDSVGVRDYWLYALPTILFHLLAAHILWRIMLRHHVNQWIATILAASFMVLGVGWQDLVWAFQLGFVASFAFGLLGVEAVEGDRPVLGAIWATCSLMCSGLGIPMVACCAFVGLARRRYKVAAITAVVPAVIFGVWWLWVAPPGVNVQLGVGQIISFVWAGITAAIAGYLRAPRVVGDLVALALAGFAIWRRNVPGALAATTLVVFVFVATGRDFLGASEATASRYSYFVIGLALPLIGQILTRVSRYQYVRPVIIIGLCLLVTVNAWNLNKQNTTWVGYTQFAHQQVEDASYLIAHGDRFPRQALVYNGLGVPDSVTVGQLSALVRDGRIPVPSSPVNPAAERARLSVYSSAHRGNDQQLTFVKPRLAPGQRCVTLAPAPFIAAFKRLHLHPQPHMVVATTVNIQLGSGAGSIRTSPVPGSTLSPGNPPTVTIFLDGLSGTATTAFIKSDDRWLNLPADGYKSALLVPSGGMVTVCPN